MKKNKKGFTLVELVITIAILLLITAIAIPSTVNLISGYKKKVDKSTEHLLFQLAKNYIDDNNYTIENDKTYCILITDIYTGEIKTSDKIEITGKIEITKNAGGEIEYKYVNNTDISSCETFNRDITLDDDTINLTSSQRYSSNTLIYHIFDKWELNENEINFKEKAPSSTPTDFSPSKKVYTNNTRWNNLKSDDHYTIVNTDYNGVARNKSTTLTEQKYPQAHYMNYNTYFCKNINFDTNSADYTLSDCIIGYMDDAVAGGYKYMCGGQVQGTTCKKVYEIEDFGEAYSSYAACDYGQSCPGYWGYVQYITKGYIHNSKQNIQYDTLTSGLFKSTDNYGLTYFLRGNVKNNYVYLHDRLWQIMRINGDGTIRIVSVDPIDDETIEWYEQTTTSSSASKSSGSIGTKSYIYIFYSDEIMLDPITGKYSLVNPTTIQHSGSAINYNSTLKNKYFITTSTTNDSLSTISSIIDSYTTNKDVVYKVDKTSTTCKVYSSSGNNGYVTCTDTTKYSSSKKTIASDVFLNPKVALDKFYNDNLSSYDHLISTGQFCDNDLNAPNQTYYEDASNYWYTMNTNNLYNRLNYNQKYVTPSYSCKQYTEYKIGTVTPDDLVFAGAISNYNGCADFSYNATGGNGSSGSDGKCELSDTKTLFNANKDNKGFYLYRNGGFISYQGTRLCDDGYINIGGEFNIANYNSSNKLCTSTNGSSNKIYPVINLKENVEVIFNGDGTIQTGTKDDPIIISESLSTNCYVLVTQSDGTIKTITGERQADGTCKVE